MPYKGCEQPEGCVFCGGCCPYNQPTHCGGYCPYTHVAQKPPDAWSGECSALRALIEETEAKRVVQVVSSPDLQLGDDYTD
jgi:hypothetical protein